VPRTRSPFSTNQPWHSSHGKSHDSPVSRRFIVNLYQHFSLPIPPRRSNLRAGPRPFTLPSPPWVCFGFFDSQLAADAERKYRILRLLVPKRTSAGPLPDVENLFSTHSRHLITGARILAISPAAFLNLRNMPARRPPAFPPAIRGPN
jgi:hypothetical protein